MFCENVSNCSKLASFFIALASPEIIKILHYTYPLVLSTRSILAFVAALKPK